MDNKPPLTYSAAVSKSLQSPLAHVTKTPTKFGLNPEAPSFVPGQRYIPQSSHQHLSTNATHLPGNVTTPQANFGPHTVQPATPKTRQAARTRGRQSSASVKSRQVSRPGSNKHIAEIITLLNNRPGEAEKKCRWLQANDPQFESLTVAQLLAKAILRQNEHRASEAEGVLIRQHTFWNGQQVSLTKDFHANMTMVRIWQAQKKYDRATEALIMMSNNHRQLKHMPPLGKSNTLTAPCGNEGIDMAMVRLQQEKGAFGHAETLLQAMRRNSCRKNPTLNLTEPCGWNKLDLAMVILQEEKGDFDRAETLLQALRKEACSQKPTLGLTEPCGKHDLDLPMVRLQQKKSNFDRAETLLQALRKYCTEKPTLELTKPSGNYELDLAMVRLQEEKGGFDRAETLLQAMRKEGCREQSTLGLTDSCDKYELDLVMVRLQEKKGGFERAETLLQAMRKECCSKKPTLGLTEPCGTHEIDLVMVRLQVKKGDFGRAETLLQTMRKECCSQKPTLGLTGTSGKYELDLAMVRLQQEKEDFDRAETLLQAMRKEYCSQKPTLGLTQPCGRYELDLAMVRLQEEKDDFDRAEILLQAMRRKYCSQQNLKLAEPCGNHELDLTMVRLLQNSGKLIGFDEYFAKYPTSANFLHARLLDYLRCSQIDEFNGLISTLPPSPDRELANSIRYFQSYVKSIINRSDSSSEGRRDEGEMALRIAEGALQKSPYNSSLLSQKAHCLRMLGRPAQEWKPLFQQANAINPKRMASEKNDYWRRDEAKALKLLGVSCQL